MSMAAVIFRRSFVASLALAAVAGMAGEALAETKRDVARDIHERRLIERRSLQRQNQEQLRPEQSRPVPPKSPNSQVVPNRP